MPMLDERVALVTGTSGGIGEAVSTVLGVASRPVTETF